MKAMVSCTKRLEFDAGHRLTTHESKCRNAHGHRYFADITVSAEFLDAVGRVVDFGVKSVVGAWLDENWDHGFICRDSDPLLQHLAAHGKTFVMDCEPTAENMATHLLDVARRLLTPHGVKVESVCLWETPSSCATAVVTP
jgi:6-pyruvoyltetrahydropterin/6-carboxytetrahydropterin synthase